MMSSRDNILLLACYLLYLTWRPEHFKVAITSGSSAVMATEASDDPQRPIASSVGLPWPFDSQSMNGRTDERECKNEFLQDVDRLILSVASADSLRLFYDMGGACCSSCALHNLRKQCFGFLESNESSKPEADVPVCYLFYTHAVHPSVHCI
jgi:hypothetical protein